MKSMKFIQLSNIRKNFNQLIIESSERPKYFDWIRVTPMIKVDGGRFWYESFTSNYETWEMRGMIRASLGFNLKFSASHCFCSGTGWLRHIQDWIVTQLSMGFLGWSQRVSFYWLFLLLMQLGLDNESNVEMRSSW